MRKKNPPILALLITLFTYSADASEVFHWPQLCERGELVITNRNVNEASVWLQKFSTKLLRETEYEIAPKTTFVLNLDTVLKDERFALLNIANENSFEVNYKCGGRDISASSVESGELLFKKTELPENQLWIQNLFTGKNEFKIIFLDHQFQPVSRQILTLISLESLTFTIPNSVKNWSYMKVSGSGKSSVFSLTETGNEKPISVLPQKSEVDPNANYFLIGPRSGSADSFIVRILDQKIIERARSLIKNPEQEKMVFAKIQKGHSGFNRNWSKPQKSFWSWHASEVTNFDDLGSTSCNGAPQELEDRMDSWLIDPGQICFWNYRVKKELTALEVAEGL